MRKVTEKAAQALLRGDNFSSGNTRVKDGVLSLHNNAIAFTFNNEKSERFLHIADCGWQTSTTKERLNGVLSIFGINGHIFQKDGEWLYQDHETLVNTVWNSSKTFAL